MTPTPVIVAIVPAKNRADSIDETVASLVGLEEIDRVVVVDDGSTDDTAEAALRSAAVALPGRVVVVQVPRNEGKGAAIAHGMKFSPDATVYLLIDADLGRTATVAHALLAPIEAGTADLVIGLPVVAAGARGGFGRVKRLAASGIAGASGYVAEAPLSGQRAVRAELLRRLVLADRFGLETAMTIDAVRSGARVLEVPVDFDHRHTGRSLSGFVHRGRQGLDIVRALWSRRTTSSVRIALMIVAATLFLAVSLVRSGGFEPSSVGASATAKRSWVAAHERRVTNGRERINVRFPPVAFPI